MGLLLDMKKNPSLVWKVSLDFFYTQQLDIHFSMLTEYEFLFRALSAMVIRSVNRNGILEEIHSVKNHPMIPQWNLRVIN